MGHFCQFTVVTSSYLRFSHSRHRDLFTRTGIISPSFPSFRLVRKMKSLSRPLCTSLLISHAPKTRTHTAAPPKHSSYKVRKPCSQNSTVLSLLRPPRGGRRWLSATQRHSLSLEVTRAEAARSRLQVAVSLPLLLPLLSVRHHFSYLLPVKSKRGRKEGTERGLLSFSLSLLYALPPPLRIARATLGGYAMLPFPLPLSGSLRFVLVDTLFSFSASSFLFLRRRRL